MACGRCSVGVVLTFRRPMQHLTQRAAEGVRIRRVRIKTESVGRWAAVAVTVALVAACSATSGIDKAGGDTVALRLAAIDRVNNNGQSYGPEAFVENLAKVSGGRIKVEVTTDYGDGAAEAESNLVKAIASGEVDGGWPSTRAGSRW